MGRFLLIAGPCLLESKSLCEEVGCVLTRIGKKYPQMRLIFKASADKANRSSALSPRGLGIDGALAILADIRDQLNVEVTSDFHEPSQAKKFAKVCDVLQVPAFLCRQTDMLAAAADTGKAVSVKKGQFLSPWDMVNVVEKLRQFGAKEIIQIERGTSFGYGNLVVDMRGLQIMAQNGCPVVYDVTHSLQLPGLGGRSTVGDRRYADTLAFAAIGAGVGGLFLETHPNPAAALCDKETQLPLANLEQRIDKYMKLHAAVKDLMYA